MFTCQRANLLVLVNLGASNVTHIIVWAQKKHYTVRLIQQFWFDFTPNFMLSLCI